MWAEGDLSGDGLSEKMTWKLRPEEEWKLGCEELERVF